jgi:Trypsin-like peptidase domain
MSTLTSRDLFADVVRIRGDRGDPPDPLGRSGTSFGSGRLIGRNLVLTSRHVLEDESGAALGNQGWEVRLLRDRVDGEWPGEPIPAQVIWRGRDNLDLALLELAPTGDPSPAYSPNERIRLRLGRFDSVMDLDQAWVAGFPWAAREQANVAKEYGTPVKLRKSEVGSLYTLTVSTQNAPPAGEDWRGFSGACVVLKQRDTIWLIGSIREVPKGFGPGMLRVASIEQAWEDADFRGHIERCCHLDHPDIEELENRAEAFEAIGFRAPVVSRERPEFFGNHLCWTVQRANRTFRVQVVEPRAYEPSRHAAIFDAVLTMLVSPPLSILDPFDKKASSSVSDPFDLITFPEAFLPLDHLLGAFLALGAVQSLGCVHVGLRPSTEESHLFTVKSLQTLIQSLSTIPNIETTDLDHFTAWLNTQAHDKRFNMACLFAIDAKQRLRVCLHPKLQRSKFEFTALPEGVMEEGTLLSVVTLTPTNKRLLTLSIQPLICSDILLQNTDRPGSRPLEAVHLDAACFGDNPPDHIDVVSVAACTRQDESAGPPPYRTWKIAFRDAFRHAVTDASMSRHRFSAFVLSNFGRDPKGGPAGLSGAFYPTEPPDHFPTNISVSCWGWPNKIEPEDPRWSKPVENYSDWKLKGHIASINPFGEGADAAVRVFGFVFATLPRDSSLWAQQPSIGNCCIRIGEYAADQSIVFSEATYG